MKPRPPASVTLADVFLARRRIAPHVLRTPLVHAEALSRRLGTAVHFKLETLQETGSFKVRGAANKLLGLSGEERAQGVVTVSTGNHGRAVAHLAYRLGIPTTVCISTAVPPHKVEALEWLGPTLVVHGACQDDAEQRAREFCGAGALTLIPPFDDPDIIAGQGTIGLELLEDLPDLDTVLVPLSGGGLAAGVAVAVHGVNPRIRVVGVSMARAPAMYRSLQAGRPVQLPEEPTLADSLQGGIGLANRYTFELVRDFVDDVVLLSEDEIASGMIYGLQEPGVVLEGAGAVGISALLHGKVRALGERVAVVLSGRNVQPEALLALASHGGKTTGQE